MSSTTGTGDVRPVSVLHLPPDARSASTARHFLRELLLAADHEAWVDGAELALSELVTNGVLHAHTELVVRVHLRADEVEVEVQDTNPALPEQPRGHDTEATVGRGLELVSALARDCGVRAEAGGKAVWFTVGDPTPPGASADELLAAWGVDDWDEGTWDVDAPSVDADAGATPTDATSQEVLLRGLPPTLWLAAREHHQALLRELVLYLAEHGAALPSPPDLVAADQARSLIWAALTEALDRAHDDGSARRLQPDGHPSSLPEVPAELDLVLHVPSRLAGAFGAMQDALDLAEQLAVADLLLARPGLPEIVAVRDWACEQVVAQLADVAPSSWGGTDQERFTLLVHDRVVPEQPDWDASVVTASDHGVVAADDANRILAISAPLARLTGWDQAELIGRRVVALIPPALREAHVAGFTRHLSTGQAKVLGVPLELPVLRRDGTQVHCHFLLERAAVNSGRPVYLAWISPLEP